MVVYDARVPADGRARIDLAIDAADTAFVQSQPIDLTVAGPGVRHEPAPDDTARQDAQALAGLLRVAETIAQALSRVAPRESWSDLDLARLVRQLVEQRIIWVHTHHASTALTLGAFTAQVEDALTACSWWAPFHAPGTAPATPAPPRGYPAAPDRPAGGEAIEGAQRHRPTRGGPWRTHRHQDGTKTSPHPARRHRPPPSPR